MPEPGSLDIVFVAAPDVIDELQQEIERGEGEVTVPEPPAPVEDATDLAFDIGELARLVTEVGPLIPATTALVSALRGVFSRRASPTQIHVESPLGKVTFEGRPDMTDEEIREVLSRLTTV
jgi:hypothetical protein